MNTVIARNQNISVPSKAKNHLLYVGIFISLIFLGLIASDVIKLSRPLLMAIGTIAIGTVFILSMADLKKFMLLFTLYLPFSRLLPGDFGTGIWAFNLTNIFIILGVIAILIEKLKSNINMLPRSSISVPLLFLCLYTFASFVFTASNFGSIYFNQQFSFVKQWLTPMVLFFLFLVAVKDKKDIERIVMLILFVIICISSLVVFEYLKVRGAEDFEKLRVSAIFEQPNRAGAFFAYYTFLLIGFFLVNLSSFKHWTLVFPILVGSRALLYTYSRGAWVAFAFAALFIAFIRSKLIFIALCLFMFFAVITPGVLPSSFYERMNETFAKDSEIYEGAAEDRLEPSAKNRIFIWKGGIEMIKDRPLFGVGYGLFPDYVALYAPQVGRRDPHNTYLMIGAELGLIGLALFLLIMFLIFKNTWFVYRKSKDRFIKSFALGFLACIVGLMVCNFFGSRLDSQELTGFFWILTALIFKSKELLIKGKIE